MSGIRLKKPTNFVNRQRTNSRSSMNRVHNYFVKAAEHGLKRRETYVSKFERPPAFSLVVDGSAASGKLRVAIERDDEPAESAQLSRWELINIARIQKMYFSPDWQSKTSRSNLRTKKGRGVRTGLGPPKNIEPRHQIYRLNHRIALDLQKRFERGKMYIDMKSPWERYAKEGDK